MKKILAFVVIYISEAGRKIAGRIIGKSFKEVLHAADEIYPTWVSIIYEKNSSLVTPNRKEQK